MTLYVFSPVCSSNPFEEPSENPEHPLASGYKERQLKCHEPFTNI